MGLGARRSWHLDSSHASNLQESVSRFYSATCGLGSAMSSITQMFGVRIDASNSFVQAAVYGFLLAGVAAFAAPVISTIRVLLSLFVLPGKSVSSLCISFICKAVTDTPPAYHLRSSRHLGPHNRCLRRHWQGICSLSCSQRIQPYSRLTHAIETRLPHSRYFVEIWPEDCDQDACYGLCVEQGRGLQKLGKAD
jgi:hypothetical protein